MTTGGEKKKHNYPGSRAGYTIPEIAELMGVSVSTAKRWLHRAEKKQGRRFREPGEIGQLIWQSWQLRFDRRLTQELRDLDNTF